MHKKFEFNHTNKWYMHYIESVLENEMHKILKNFELKMDHLILARQPDQEPPPKKNLSNSELCCSGWLQGKNERKYKER